MKELAFYSAQVATWTTETLISISSKRKRCIYSAQYPELFSVSPNLLYKETRNDFLEGLAEGWSWTGTLSSTEH